MTTAILSPGRIPSLHDSPLDDLDDDITPGSNSSAMKFASVLDGREEEEGGSSSIPSSTKLSKKNAGSGDIDILDDDITTALHEDELKSRTSVTTTTTKPQASISTLPSYQSLMASLQEKKSAEKDVKLSVATSSTSSFSLVPSITKAASSSSSPSSPANPDDENRGYLQDDEDAVSESNEEEEDDESEDLSKSKSTATSFDSMYKRAVHLEDKGLLRKAAHYYLYLLEKYRYSQEHQEKIVMCLRRLGDICYKNKKYKEALQFRTAERMVYESNLLRIVKSDADAQTVAAANSSSSSSSKSSVSKSSSSSSSARSFLSHPSSDPTPIVQTPITPKALLAEEDRALKYESLARVFYAEKNIAMAKSYVLKAVEIRRKLKEKWGDASKMSVEELLLHQLSVMGKEEYETTLRKYKNGGKDDSNATVDYLRSEYEETKNPASETDSLLATSKRLDEMKAEMTKSLQLLVGGKLDSTSATNSSSSTAANIDNANTSAALLALSSTTKGSKFSNTLRQRQGQQKNPNLNKKKTVEFDGDVDELKEEKSSLPLIDDASTSTASSSTFVDSTSDLSSLVIERPSRSPSKINIRALTISFLLAVFIVFIVYYLMTTTFQDQFFPALPKKNGGVIRGPRSNMS